MKMYTGQMGMVLKLDPCITRIARDLYETIPENLIQWKGASGPHLSLYHTKLKNVSHDFILQLLADIGDLCNFRIVFEDIVFYGGHFIFWNAWKNTDLVRLHNLSLSLAKFFVAGGEQQADRESLVIPPDQRKNVQKYGHPLVRKQWMPHITVGYQNVLSAKLPKKILAEGEIKSVEFIRVGVFGSIEKTILRRDVK